MATSITNGQRAAKIACARHGVVLEFYDYASLANAVQCGGPQADVLKCARSYFQRNHREIELTEEQLADIGQAVYMGLRGVF